MSILWHITLTRDAKAGNHRCIHHIVVWRLMSFQTCYIRCLGKLLKVCECKSDSGFYKVNVYLMNSINKSLWLNNTQGIQWRFCRLYVKIAWGSILSFLMDGVEKEQFFLQWACVQYKSAFSPTTPIGLSVGAPGKRYPTLSLSARCPLVLAIQTGQEADYYRPPPSPLACGSDLDHEAKCLLWKPRPVAALGFPVTDTVLYTTRPSLTTWTPESILWAGRETFSRKIADLQCVAVRRVLTLYMVYVQRM